MHKDKKEHCGLFGVYGCEDAAVLTYLGLFALQHRGEESAGIATFDGKKMHSHKGMGLVGDVFNGEKLKALPGKVAIGHARYSTTGSSLLQNAQPLVVDYSRGTIAIAHNGNLINALLLRSELEAYGSIFQTTSDSEIIVHLMARPQSTNQTESLFDALRTVKGAYSLVLLMDGKLVGVRGPNGFRPLCIGKRGKGYVLASETCALDLIGAEFVRDVTPGEVVIIDDAGIHSHMPFDPALVNPSPCIFEYVYFSRPDSSIFGQNVHIVRQRLGRQLAREHAVEADIVISVPDSGNSAALGYSAESGIPLEQGLVRNHYIGRTFIQPAQDIRDFKVRVKFNPLKEVLKGKRVVVVDDSIVRGTTCKTRVKNLREAGAKEIHMRVSCPPIKHSCFYGIDFPTTDNLIAAHQSLEAIRKFIGADTLGYLSLEGLLSAVRHNGENYCAACYSGNYPVDFGRQGDKFAMEKSTLGTIGEK